MLDGAELAALLDEVVRFVRRFVVLDDEQAAALVLWIAAHLRLRRRRLLALPGDRQPGEAFRQDAAARRPRAARRSRLAGRDALGGGRLPQDRNATTRPAARRGRRDLAHRPAQRQPRGAAGVVERRQPGGRAGPRCSGSRGDELRRVRHLLPEGARRHRRAAGHGRRPLDRARDEAARPRPSGWSGSAAASSSDAAEAIRAALASWASRRWRRSSWPGPLCRPNSTIAPPTPGSRCSRSPTWPAATGRSGPGGRRSRSLPASSARTSRSACGCSPTCAASSTSTTPTGIVHGRRCSTRCTPTTRRPGCSYGRTGKPLSARAARPAAARPTRSARAIVRHRRATRRRGTGASSSRTPGNATARLRANLSRASRAQPAWLCGKRPFRTVAAGRNRKCRKPAWTNGSHGCTAGGRGRPCERQLRALAALAGTRSRLALHDLRPARVCRRGPRDQVRQAVTDGLRQVTQGHVPRAGRVRSFCGGRIRPGPSAPLLEGAA